MKPLLMSKPPAILFITAALFLAISFSVFNGAALADAEEDLTLEEIAKSDAAKFYVSRQFEKSLEAFIKLEAQYPKNTVLKRYTASLYETLRRFDDAELKLKEALAINGQDWIAHQMLGEVYIKQARFDQAKEEFSLIKNNSADTPLGKYADQRISLIQQMLNSKTADNKKQMPVSDFMKSEAAQQFAKGRFQEALAGFDGMLSQYPDDILIRRFKAIAQTRLGKYDDAVATFQESMRLEPENVATRYYLAMTYMQQGAVEKARDELRWVMEHDESSYKLRAQQALFMTLNAGQPKSKPWTVTVSQAYDYDSNAIYNSNDNVFSSDSDQNAHKFSTIATGTYRVYQKGRWTITPDMLYAQTLHDELPYLNTYTPGAGISFLYGTSLLKKPLFINIREGQTFTLLKNKFYVWSNSLSTSFIYLPHPKNRITVTHRFNYNKYDNDGSSPDLTSRDGYVNTSSLLNNYYFNTAKTLFVSVGYDYEYQNTEGVNFIKLGHVGRLGFHFPIFYKFEGDLSYVLKDYNYNQYASTPPKRRDDVHNFTATISRDLTPHISWSSSYTFEDSRAKNNIYEYTRHDAGTKISLKY